MTPLIVHLGFLLAAPGEPDPNTVTPGVIGFFAIAFVGLATVLLGRDMVKRIRRTTYREEIKARLESEIAERDGDTKPE
ncbi:hypothetical protein JF66_04925 [Cryobacterium sp. MLB-32]|uniref:hypothetical protein n=1 Tax=Cryobacterium sp. MLB-32 TaxID=1529318 RepID=UPI0004E66DFA|nr:hypothetical protein [Cryobacterium sp. MLB-32]KFF60390.1 hypothetical protein JF66_04925 [Cryobacterium sp. MLB-32]